MSTTAYVYRKELRKILDFFSEKQTPYLECFCFESSLRCDVPTMTSESLKITNRSTEQNLGYLSCLRLHL